MIRTVTGAILIVLGILKLLGSFGSRGGLSFSSLLLAGILIYLGQQIYRGRSLLDSPVGEMKVSAGSYPSTFQAAFWNRNIAIDTTAGAVWLRDGQESVLSKKDIVRIEAMSDSSNHQTLIGPRTVHLHNRLMVTTRDLNKPVWTVRFNAHPERTMGGSAANYKEAHEWEGRLRAFVES